MADIAIDSVDGQPYALCGARDGMTWWPVVASCTRPRGHTQPDHYDGEHGLFWPDAKAASGPDGTPAVSTGYQQAEGGRDE